MDFFIPQNSETRKFNKHWQFCVGSGHAGLALRADYVKQLKYIHDELGIQRVRFHGIFCDDMHTIHTMNDLIPIPGTDNIKEQSFRQCGIVYDNILSCGMKPFVELSFMPQYLAKGNSRGGFFYKPNISMPKSDEEWVSYIKDFIRFLLERYGEEEVESWFFEVWNEPDLQVAFFDGTQEDYFHLYEITVRAIKEVNKSLMVGGPATSGSKWIDSFLEFCKDNDVPVDFVTTHQYAGDPLGGVEEGKENEEMPMDFNIAGIFSAPKDSVLPAFRAFMPDKSEIDDVPDNVFVNNSSIVKKQADGLPVYYTEWNTTAICTAFTNDTRKVAAYDVKTALNVEENVTGSSIWCFSDIFEEFHQFPEEFHGGFGILTQSGIPKPIFHALKMLADAGDKRYVLPDSMNGEISLAAFKGDGKIQVLLTRQKMKNLNLPKEHAKISVELPQAPTAVHLERIDEEHCNPLKLWEDMGSPQTPTPTQVKSIFDSSAMVCEDLPYTYDDGKLTFEADLGVNDVYFVTISI